MSFMKLASLGFVIASALWALLPQAAGAQCEGGSTFAGRYRPDGTYWPGGCAYTNATTPGQMYPSGAQPVPSTNPAAGVSALPGQRVATGQLPITGDDRGYPLGAIGAGGPTGGWYPSISHEPGAWTGGTAYGYSLPVAPAVSSEAESPTAPGAAPAPAPPGRGGPTFVGEESGDSPTITLPNQ
jgi:hypothetical protein